MCKALHPKFWIRTHDERKNAEGYIARVIKRTPWSAGDFIGQVDNTRIVELKSGETITLDIERGYDDVVIL